MVMIPSKNTRAQQGAERDSKAAAIKRFNARKAWFSMELQRQAANRFQMALDEAYYDNDQWMPDEAAVLRSRNQAPVVFNEVKPVCDFLIGTEMRSRIDFFVTNRTDNTDAAYEDAQAKTHLLKFIDSVNRSQFVRSSVAEDQIKAGLGWKEVGVRADPTEMPIYVGHESWRNMLYDSLGNDPMTDDWRYIFRFKEVDFDIAEAMCPRDKVDALRSQIISAGDRKYMDTWNGVPVTGGFGQLDGGLTGKWTSYDAEAWLNNPRDRVMLIECWNREPTRNTTGQGEGLNDRMSMRMRCSIMTETTTLIESWSPYRHGKFPFIPQWCYRRKQDGAPYGVIRQHRGPQDALNKHMSKAQYRNATRQVMLEAGALNPEVMDEDELQERIADPAAILHFASGALTGGRVVIREGSQLAAADVQMAQHYAQAIRSLSPVSMEDRGQDPADVSGKARQIRRDQGSVMTAAVFDQMLLSRQIEGELVLSLAEQYQTDKLTFPKAGDGRRASYITINDDDPSDPGARLNDITLRKATFVVGESPWQQSMAESAFESLMSMSGELAKVAPQVVVSILDILFSMHPNLPKREQILARIRQATGQTDPDERETPEQQQKKANDAAVAKEQFEAQMAQLHADIREANAKGEKMEAEAMMTRSTAVYEAAQAAQVLTAAPQIAPVADSLIRSAGFKDQDGESPMDGSVPVVPPNQPMPPQGGQALPELQQADGAQAGIETMQADGLRPEGV